MAWFIVTQADGEGWKARKKPAVMLTLALARRESEEKQKCVVQVRLLSKESISEWMLAASNKGQQTLKTRLWLRVAPTLMKQDKKQATKIESKPQVVKKEKGKGKATQKRNRVEDDQSDGQDDLEDSGLESDHGNAGIDVADFKDQPLGRAEAQKLHGLATDWRDINKKIQQSFGGVRQVAVAMAGAVEDEQGEQSLEELDVMMRELIDVSAEMDAHERALDEIYQLIGRGEQISDALDRYQDAVNAMARDYIQKTARQKYAKNEQYVKFKEDIYGILHPDLPMRPITELIAREDGDASDDEDDLEVGGITQDYKCPLTLTPFVEPLTSAVCRHSFSAEAIRAYFGASRGSKKCPSSGCTQSFRLTDCVPDRELAKKVKIWIRRKQRNDEESDAEEVIE